MSPFLMNTELVRKYEREKREVVRGLLVISISTTRIAFLRLNSHLFSQRPEYTLPLKSIGGGDLRVNKVYISLK